MKKRIVLALIVALAAAGAAFAQSGRNIPCYYTPPGPNRLAGITILECVQTLTGVNITYSSSEAYGTVVFTFTAYRKAPFAVGGTSTETWTNTERITSPRSSSTWRFSAAYPSNIEKIVVIAEQR